GDVYELASESYDRLTATPSSKADASPARCLSREDRTAQLHCDDTTVFDLTEEDEESDPGTPSGNQSKQPSVSPTPKAFRRPPPTPRGVPKLDEKDEEILGLLDELHAKDERIRELEKSAKVLSKKATGVPTVKAVLNEPGVPQHVWRHWLKAWKQMQREVEDYVELERTTMLDMIESLKGNVAFLENGNRLLADKTLAATAEPVSNEEAFWRSELWIAHGKTVTDAVEGHQQLEATLSTTAAFLEAAESRLDAAKSECALLRKNREDLQALLGDRRSSEDRIREYADELREELEVQQARLAAFEADSARRVDHAVSRARAEEVEKRVEMEAMLRAKEDEIAELRRAMEDGEESRKALDRMCFELKSRDM
ncbi:hypothetical protein HK101_002400, partial [Irineochytrium annulatum]